jgi:DNA-binding NtrC family response regulator
MISTEIRHRTKGELVKVAAGPKEVRQLGTPVVVLLSADDSLTRLVNSAVQNPWRFEHHIHFGGPLDFLNADVRLVVLDDQAVGESDRGWLLGQIRRHMERATLLYVTAHHTAENERRARSHGACYYTSKPIHNGELAGVLRAFMEVADRNFSA